MRVVKAAEEAILRSLAARHGFMAESGPYAGEGSASRLITALIAGEVSTVLLTPGELRKLVRWLETASSPAPDDLTGILDKLIPQLRAALPSTGANKAVPAKKASSRAAKRLSVKEAAALLELSTSRVQELARQMVIGRKIDGRWTFTRSELLRYQQEALIHKQARALRAGRPRRRSTRRSSDRFTRDDMDLLSVLDTAVDARRRLDRSFSLAPIQSGRMHYATHACQRCGEPVLLVVFGGQVVTPFDCEEYRQLLSEELMMHNLPSYVLSEAQGILGNPATTSSDLPDLADAGPATDDQPGSVGPANGRADGTTLRAVACSRRERRIRADGRCLSHRVSIPASQHSSLRAGARSASGHWRTPTPPAQMMRWWR